MCGEGIRLITERASRGRNSAIGVISDEAAVWRLGRTRAQCGCGGIQVSCSRGPLGPAGYCASSAAANVATWFPPPRLAWYIAASARASTWAPDSCARIATTPIDNVTPRERAFGNRAIASTVRCNADGEIGFVEDERRLNVAWTRPRLGLVIVGDRRTLEANSGLWRRALAACAEVVIARPEEGV